MANVKIADLASYTTPTDADVLPIVDVTSDTTKKVAVSDLLSNVLVSGEVVNADINAAAEIVDTKLATISTAGKVSNSATTATDANTPSAIVARDASGNFSAGTITANLDGNATTVTTNANLTGDITSVGNATSIAAGVIVDSDINASAAIADTKLATISTAGKVSNSATTATDANTPSAIVARDASGNFSAGTITAALIGNSSTATALSSQRTFAVTGDVAGTVNSDLTSGASIATTLASNINISTSGTIATTSTLAVGQPSATANTQVDLAGTYAQTVVAVAALDIDCSLGNYFTKTISADSTFTFSNVPSSRAYAFVLELTHTSGIITWPVAVKWPADTAPTLTTGTTHLFVFVTDDNGTRWRASSLIDYVN